MADLSTEQLQAALDRLSESFTGLGSRMDAQSDAFSEAEETQRKADRQLAKFGLNIEERNKQLRQEIDIQEELEKQLKDNVAGYASLSKAQQEDLKIKKLQETATKDRLKQLKDESDAIQGLTREQNAAIEAQQRLNKRKQEEADSTKHAGDKVTNTFNQMSSASGIMAAAQAKATERFGGTAAAAAGINLAFTGLQMGVQMISLAFDQYLQQIDQAFQNQLAYNREVALGADGMKKANMMAIANMKQDAARHKQNFDQNLGFAKQLGILTLGMGGLGVAAAVTRTAIMGITGPVGLFVAVLTAIGTWWFGKKAMEEKSAEQASEAAAQRLEIESALLDMMYKNFNELGKATMTGVGGMTALTQASHRAGFAIKDMDKFAGVLKASQRDISLFGTTAVQGVDKFATVTGMMTDKFGMHFRNLGMDQEEQAAATEKYMALQARLGLMQNKTQEQLAMGAAKYLDELDKTATMLGQSRKEQEDARAAIEGIEQLQAAAMDADAKGDTARKEEIERAIKAAGAIQKTDPKVAAGLAKLIASKGAVSDEDTQKALQSVPKTLEAIRKGTGSELSREFGAQKELANTYKRTAGGFAATGVDMGLTSGSYKAAGDAAKRDKNIQDELDKRASAQGVSKGSKEYDKILEEILSREAKDGLTKNYNQEMVKQQKDSIASDKSLLVGIGTFDKGAEKFSNAVDKFAGGGSGGGSGGSSGGTVAGRADATVRQAQQAASNQVAGNYSKTQMTAEEARNILDNGSARDIAAFGGQDALTKIALSKTAPAAAQAAAPKPAGSPMRGAAPAAPAAAPTGARGGGSSAPAAAPVAAPAAGKSNPSVSVSAPAAAPASFSAAGSAHAGQGGTTPVQGGSGRGGQGGASAPTASFSVAGSAHAGQGGTTPVQGGSGRGGQGGMGFPSGAPSAQEAKNVGAATPTSPVPDFKLPKEGPAKQKEPVSIPKGTEETKGKGKGKRKTHAEEMAEMTPKAKEFVDAARSMGITNPYALRALAITSAKESHLSAESREDGADPYLKTLKGKGLDYIRKVFPQIKGRRMEIDPKTGKEVEKWGYLAKKLGFPDGVPAEYLEKEWSKGDEAFFNMMYGGLSTNKKEGDGYKYRGRGLIQVTGRENYANVGRMIGVPLEEDPDLITKDFPTAAKAAVAYMFSASGGKSNALKTMSGFSDNDEALKWTLQGVAGRGHLMDEYGKAGSHLHEQYKKAQDWLAVGDSAISAADGGIVDGPSSGFPATLHGNEIITPLSPNSILEQLGKTSVEEMKSMGSGDSMREFYSAQQAVMEMLSTKLDDMIDKLERGNNYSDKLVKAMA